MFYMHRYMNHFLSFGPSLHVPLSRQALRNICLSFCIDVSNTATTYKNLLKARQVPQNGIFFLQFAYAFNNSSITFPLILHTHFMW